MSEAKGNPLLQLPKMGQSVWLDYLHRRILDSGELAHLIGEDGLRGVTSNPQIFQEAITGGDTYDEAIRDLVNQGKNADEIYETLAIEDIQRAADLFRAVYDSSGGRHGFVSLEVNPHLARDTEGTIHEARRLWQALERPNVFIKVPATLEGLPAITRLIAEGVNINVTLLFGLPRYREVAEAYLAGLEERLRQDLPVNRVASVASFFLSRIDVLVDSLLEEKIKASGQAAKLAGNLKGEVAIASARNAYQIFKELFHGDRFERLATHGARPQRVLWASTGTKDPEYSDVKYVEPLIGPQTVNTLPLKTLKAYRDHGEPESRLDRNLDKARKVLEDLAETGINLDQVTRQLEEEGIEKFNKPFDKLMASLEAHKK